MSMVEQPWLWRWAPEAVRAGDVGRARLVVVTCVVGCLGASFAGLWHFRFGVPAIGGVYLAAGASALLIVPLQRRARSSHVGGHAVAAVWTTCFLIIAFMRGGIWTSAMLLCAVAPLLATALVSRAAGVGWGLLVVLGTAGLGLAPLFGVEMEDPLPASGAYVARVMGGVVFAAFALLVSWFLASRMREALAEAERAERERVLADAETQMLRTERMASIGRLAAGTAHEINNPLTYVIGNLEHVQDELENGAPTPEKLVTVERALRDALEGARRIQRIVQDMKTYGRIDEEGGSADLESVLESAIRISASELQHKTRVVREHAELPVVVGDSGRLVQVFINLLVNAAQALTDDRGDENEIRIRVTRDGASVVVAVSDNGRGIAPEDVPRVTEPFFTTKPVGEGTGLGLSVSRNIVERFGGALTIESALGKGTTVTVRLRRAGEAGAEVDAAALLGRAAEVAEATEATLCDRGVAPPPRVAKIMLIDDDHLVVRAMKRILHKYDVTTVETGADALALLRGDSSYDVVFCDLMMPGMSGMDVYERVLEERAEIAPRMVFISGGAFTPRSQEFLERIENRFVEKPFDPRVLEDIVQEALESSSRA